MDSLIVLGLVPGTTIQITFEMWLQGFFGLILLVSLAYIYRIATYKVELDSSRTALHASQLHRRAI